MSSDGREMERSKSGIKSVRLRLRIAFPYRVTALGLFSRSYQRPQSDLSLAQHEWRRHGMRSRDVCGADGDLDALHRASSTFVVLIK
ncbi:jg27243 [Pararge aegeria aegeria]|uniref:Jg27243 protein n=1 Tax=Pararge aegeria aegeria TaxID=348720 RepID=A0A8S4RT32_9NEOP|nr:jg27243 [Pararge aegeria aegeria]